MKQQERNLQAIYISLKYLRRNLLALPLLMLLSIPVAYYLKGYSWAEAIQIGPMVNLSAFLLLGFIPTAIVHINHYRANKHLSIQINTADGIIAFSSKKGSEKETYALDHLKISQHLSYFHDKSTKLLKYISTPWSNYSYLKVETEKGKTYYISSTIIAGNQLSFIPAEKHFTFWPTIKKLPHE